MTLPIQELTPSLQRNIFHTQPCASLFESMPAKTLKKGEILFHGPSNHVYLVIKGMIKQSSWHKEKEVLEDYFQAGELINCEILLSHPPKKQIIEALFNGTVIKRIPGPAFLEAVQSNKSIQQAVLANVFASLHRTREKVHRFSILSSEQRVVHFLLGYAARSGRRVGFELVIKPFLTHREIGQIAGASRQTVSTVLNRLRKDGLIHFTRQYLLIRDLDALKDISMDVRHT